MKVIQNISQIASARQMLINKGASSMASSRRSELRRFGLARVVVVGDQVKSWDVLATLNFIEQHVQKKQHTG